MDINSLFAHFRPIEELAQVQDNQYVLICYVYPTPPASVQVFTEKALDAKQSNLRRAIGWAPVPPMDEAKRILEARKANL